MGGNSAISEWRHYPDGEVYDPNSHAQYFYHAHPVSGRPTREHGHFHTFLRAEGMPVGTAPLLLPEIAVAEVPALPPQAPPLKRGTREEVSHLVAIAVDPRGEPIRLFTTNRWVTGETWYRADDVIRMLDRFAIAEVEPSATLNRWVEAILRLFRPQIAALLRARDETVMAWRRRRRTHCLRGSLARDHLEPRYRPRRSARLSRPGSIRTCRTSPVSPAGPAGDGGRLG